MNGEVLDEVKIDEYNIQLDPTLSKGLSQTQQIIATLQEGALSVKDRAISRIVSFKGKLTIIHT